jgi:invasion protein IalB
MVYLKKYIYLIFLYFLLNNQVIANVDINTFVSPWYTKCLAADKKSNQICTMQRTMFANKEQTIQIASLVLETSIQRRYARFSLISPLGAFIPHGVRISLDNQVIAKIPFGYCESNGCYSTVDVKDDVIEKFKKSKFLILDYLNKNQKSITVKIPMDEFKDSYNKIRQSSKHKLII